MTLAAPTAANILNIAIVGHTNTGKTSLMRTLTRQRDFGEVSARAATTRHVEVAELTVGNRALLRLYDTPGFEDSSGLIAHIGELREAHHEDWIETLQTFAADPSQQAGFTQEAKALRQILVSDILLYVIDTRDPVRAKHRDELELLGRCARPVLPVLNFVASGTGEDGTGNAKAWREQMARVNMHAVVAFDTVVYREADELALYRKLATLADRFAPLLEALIDQLVAARAAARRASTVLIAELIVDVASARRGYPARDQAAMAAVATAFKNAVRQRERQAVAALLRINRFADDDYLPLELPFAHGIWQEDLFDPVVLERFGFAATKSIAAGATAGLAIDLMTGGLTLGAAAATGAAIGFVLDSARRYTGGILDRVRGTARMTVATPTLQALIEREAALTIGLLQRGHGAQTPVRQSPCDLGDLHARLASLIKQARRTPAWSVLSDGLARRPASADRRALIEQIADRLDTVVTRATGP